MTRITRKPIIYFANPFTHEDISIQLFRTQMIRDILVKVLNEQDAIIPFSPVSYTQPFEAYCAPDFDWYAWDIQFLARCDGMLVIQMEGWSISEGIQKEIRYCRDNGIQFEYSTPENVLEALKAFV